MNPMLFGYRERERRENGGIDPKERIITRVPHAPICSANWHLRQVEQILTEEEEREAVTASGKYGTDELHDCKIAVWKLLEKLPEGV